MGAGSYPFQKLFSRSHFAPKLGMPFVAELQQGKLSSAVLSFSTVEVCSSDLTHMHVIVTKKKTYQKNMGSRMPDLQLIPRMDGTLHPFLQKNIGKSKNPTSQQVLRTNMDVFKKIQRPK